MPKISIIVPVYKAEKYLRRCLDSIVAQIFTDWECILVDDGSPDNSGKICDEYAKKDERFRVIHQENAGVSAARNKGLDEAKGEWIGFVDSDDWISNDYFTIDYPQADIIQKKIYNHKFRTSKINSKINLKYFFVNFRTNNIWDKLFKRKLIGKKRFDENIKIGEDFLFQLSLVYEINHYCFSNIGFYVYTDNDTSAMHSIDGGHIRMKIIETNISKLSNIIVDDNEFRQNIIFKSYLPFFYNYRAELTESQKELLSKILIDLKVSNFTYLSFYSKLKVYYYKILLSKIK